jgi:hypothetical protein
VPNNLIKKLAKEAEKTVTETEEVWEAAKKQADQVFKDKPKDGDYWAFVNKKTQEKIGVDKKK